MSIIFASVWSPMHPMLSICPHFIFITQFSDISQKKKNNGNRVVVDSRESVSLFSLTDSLSRVKPQIFVLLVYLEFPDSTLQ